MPRLARLLSVGVALVIAVPLAGALALRVWLNTFDLPTEREWSHADRNPLVVASPTCTSSGFVAKAFVAAEDKAFFSRPPFNVYLYLFVAIARGRQNGSIITDQLARNILARRKDLPTRTRVVEEVLLVEKIDGAWSRERILAEYLDTAYLGHNAYGVEVAARSYFGSSRAQLTLAQAAYLAALARQPATLPILADKGASRRNQVLDKMVELGAIEPLQADAGKAEAVSFTETLRN